MWARCVRFDWLGRGKVHGKGFGSSVGFVQWYHWGCYQGLFRFRPAIGNYLEQPQRQLKHHFAHPGWNRPDFVFCHVCSDVNIVFKFVTTKVKDISFLSRNTQLHFTITHSVDCPWNGLKLTKMMRPSRPFVLVLNKTKAWNRSIFPTTSCLPTRVATWHLLLRATARWKFLTCDSTRSEMTEPRPFSTFWRSISVYRSFSSKGTT